MKDVTEDHLHKFKAHSGGVDADGVEDVRLTLEVGYEIVQIEKIFGPMIFADLRLRAEPSTCEWIIERLCGFGQIEEGDGPEIWKEWVRIPGQLREDFNGHPELQEGMYDE